MPMIADVLPQFNRFLRPLKLEEDALQMISRVIIAFMLHTRRMSCLQAAGALKSQPRHRAQVSRFLARPQWRALDINGQLRETLLEMETEPGPFIFIVDATLCV